MKYIIVSDEKNADFAKTSSSSKYNATGCMSSSGRSDTIEQQYKELLSW